MYANLQDIRARFAVSLSTATTTNQRAWGFSFLSTLSIPGIRRGLRASCDSASVILLSYFAAVAWPFFTTTVLVSLSVSFFVSRISYIIHKHREAREGGVPLWI